MLPITSLLAAVLVPSAPVIGLPPERGFDYPYWQAAWSWLVLAAFAILFLCLSSDRRRARRVTLRVVANHAASASAPIRRRVPAAWSNGLDTRVVHPPRTGAGGTIGRVPPRPAAGSPLRVVRRAPLPARR